MQTKVLSCALLSVLCMATASCVDDNYDLSDIDTTTRVTVDNLTVPMNMDPLVLSDIISIDEDSKIQAVTIDGNEFYALSQKGEFNSDPIYVDKVKATAPTLTPTQRTLQIAPDGGIVADGSALTYEIVEMGNEFTYTAGNIDEAIVELNSAVIDPLEFRIDFEVRNISGIVEKMTFSDLTLQLPEGLEATVSDGSYDSASGIWTIPAKEVGGNTGAAVLTATAIDFVANGSRVENHTLKFDNRFRIQKGFLTVVPKAGTTLPGTVDLYVSYKMGDIVVDSFTGVVKYELEGMDIDPMDLSDIPDFLSGDETDITIANPQIYLQVNNPVADYSLECSTGITLTAIREGYADRAFSPDVNQINIGFDKGIAGPYNFVLAPSSANLTVPAGYESPSFVEFSTLGSLVSAPADASVKGLPDMIGITLDNPGIKQSAVSNFALGRRIDGINGRYELMAPLALGAGSEIVYSDTKDGWNDEDVDAITITELIVTAKASSTVPMGASISAYPIDVAGKPIQGVTVVTESALPANAEDADIRIVMHGEIKHIDGVTFEARVKSEDSSVALAPSQTITLKEIRATVSGYYEKEL